MRDSRRSLGKQPNQRRTAEEIIVEGDVFTRLLSGDKSVAADAANLLGGRILYLPLTYEDVVPLMMGSVLKPPSFTGRKFFCVNSSSLTQYMNMMDSRNSYYYSAFLLGKFGRHDVPIFNYNQPYFVGSVITPKMQGTLRFYIPDVSSIFFDQAVATAKERGDCEGAVVYLSHPLCEDIDSGFVHNEPRCLYYLRLPNGSRVVSRKGLVHFVMADDLRSFNNAAAKITVGRNGRYALHLYDTETIESACSIPDRVARSFFKKLGVRLG